jgi:molybdopterin biosynthesis enzyme
VIARCLTRDTYTPEAATGQVLAHDVRDAAGRIALPKGRVLTAADAGALPALPWTALHLIGLEPGEVHEADAGERLARASAGPGVVVGPLGGGHWPMASAVRGIVQVDVAALDAINAVEGLCVYTLYDGQVVDAAELVARAKIVPLAIARSLVDAGVAIADRSQGVVAVRAFQRTRVAAVVQESLGDRAIARFRAAFAEKLDWLGAEAVEPIFVPADATALARGLRAAEDQGATVIAVAGGKAMDPLDPVFEAVRAVGGRIVRQGVPAHPGSLCWIARTASSTMVGMPSCGLFSRATVFDLLLPRLLIGERLDAGQLSRLGHGGFLTPDMTYRFPPYRDARQRGAIDDDE